MLFLEYVSDLADGPVVSYFTPAEKPLALHLARLYGLRGWQPCLMDNTGTLLYSTHPNNQTLRAAA